MSNDWSETTDWETVCRRAGGRRHYNAWRGFMRLVRRAEVVKLLGRYSLLDHGTRAKIARELKVHRSTITRDLQALLNASANRTRGNHA